MALDAEAANIGYDSTLLDISPDGRTLVYMGSSKGTARLFTRQLDTLRHPAARGHGRRAASVLLAGRSVRRLSNQRQGQDLLVHDGNDIHALRCSVGVIGTWTSDDQLFFAADEGRRLFRVNARGGDPVTGGRPAGRFQGSVA